MRLFAIIPFVTITAIIYVLARLWQMAPSAGPWRVIPLTAGIAATASFFLYFFIGGHVPSAVTSFIYKLGTSWFFILLYLLMIILLADILRLTGVLPKSLFHENPLVFGLLAGFITLVFGYGYICYQWKDRVELDIALNKDLGGAPVRIVAVSDLHLGHGIGGRELRRWVKMINAENPDVVLIAGDMIDTDTGPLYEKDMAEICRELRPRYGTYMAFGNHEYIAGAEKSMAFLEKTGITVLRDSSALIDGRFYVTGRDDLSNSRREPVDRLLEGLDTAKLVILLDHQPYHLERAEKAGVDLQISGHTHRGQVWPISWITDAMYEKSHGYLRKGGSHFYVSSGLGIWGGKFRIGTRSEYVVIDIHSSK